MSDTWYYAINGKQQGPISFDQLKEGAVAGHFKAADKVWKEGTADWVGAGTVADLFPAQKAGPPPIIQKPIGSGAATITIEKEENRLGCGDRHSAG
jgi:hypothetical protein